MNLDISQIQLLRGLLLDHIETLKEEVKDGDTVVSEEWMNFLHKTLDELNDYEDKLTE